MHDGGDRVAARRERVWQVSARRLGEVRRHLDTIFAAVDDALSGLRRVVEE